MSVLSVAVDVRVQILGDLEQLFRRAQQISLEIIAGVNVIHVADKLENRGVQPEPLVDEVPEK